MGAPDTWDDKVSHQILDPRVHLFRRSVMGFEVAAVLLLTERFNVVIDTLCCPSDMLPVQLVALRSGRSRPILVVNTHSDWDHVWGNSTFVGHPIFAHHHCLERMRLHGQAEIDEMRRRNPAIPPIPLHLPDITFDGTLTVSGGDITFQLLHTPGHTDDSVSVYVPELGLVIAGDTVEYPIPRLSQAGLAQAYIRELYRLSALKPGLVIPSHGPVSQGTELIHANIAYLRGLVHRIRLKPGTSLQQLQEELLPEELLPASYDMDFEPSVRQAHRDNISYIFHELFTPQRQQTGKLEGMV